MHSIRLVSLFSIILVTVGFSLTDQELLDIRNGFENRRNLMLDSQISSPYPSTNYPGDGNLGDYVWNRQDFALSALYRNVSLVDANQAVIDACNALIANPPLVADDGFHWHGNLFYRIYKYFYHGSRYFPGRLSPQAESSICEVMWLWAKEAARIADADYSQHQTWVYWYSENHDIMMKSTSYSAADILKDVPEYMNRTYDDGSTAARQYDVWNQYFKEYIPQRAKKGLFVEFASHTYTKYTLQGIYNFYDFAADAQLRKLAGNILDLWWTDWALDQINAVRGGAKCRVYQEDAVLATSDSAYMMSWYYLDSGLYRGRHPGIMCMATSRYRLPLAVMDIALDTVGKGCYEYFSRRPGLKLFEHEDRTVGIDSQSPAILRYTYHTPEYILGTLMCNKLPADAWTAISSQNRWVGAVFSADANARIFPQCVGLNNAKTYNQYWSVQKKGTLIVQKLDTSLQSGDMRVFFSGSDTGMTLSQDDGWVFARLPDAFAAIRPAWGGYTWDDSNWIRFNDQYAPVIMEIWRSGDFDNIFSLFKSSVFSQSINVDAEGILTYTGLKDSGTFTFYTDSAQLPLIDGSPVNLNPDFTFNSPFLNESWDSGVVNVSKDERLLRLNFNCEFRADITDDCIVDINDFAILAKYWLQCSTPEASYCVDARGIEY